MDEFNAIITFYFSELPLALQDSVYDLYNVGGLPLHDAFINALSVWSDFVFNNSEV